jgi:hypothetical protein
MGKYINLTGMRFGRFIVIKRIGVNADNKPLWQCQCDCGNIRNVAGKSLKNGNSKSCGCYQKDIARRVNTTHGLRHHKLYSIHQNMNRRCFDPKDRAYKNYGARGISVCSSWAKTQGFMNFYEWALKTGYEENLTLDRIDNDGNYEPVNCRFVDYGTQARNRRTQVNSTTGVSGVQYRKTQKDYRVVISLNGKRYSCGCYKSLNAAILVRKQAEHKYWAKGGDTNGG